jgi:hypothetical protein
MLCIYHVDPVAEVRRISLRDIPDGLGLFYGFSIEAYNLICFFENGILRLSLRSQDTQGIAVESLSLDLNKTQLYNSFKGFGKILSYEIKQNDQGQVIRFIYFQNEEDAINAVMHFNTAEDMFVEPISLDEDDDLQILNEIIYENSNSRTLKLDMMYHVSLKLDHLLEGIY